MPVYGVFVYKIGRDAANEPSAAILSQATDMSSLSFFTRGTATEVMNFGCRSVAPRGRPGARQVLKLENNIQCCLLTHSAKKLAVTVATDGEYPARVAFSLAARAMDGFLKHHAGVVDAPERFPIADRNLKFPELPGMIKEFQDPTNADVISKIEKDLDETKQILTETIESLFEREEKLRELQDKSNDLSVQSRVFLKNSEKMNGCCVIL